MKSKSDKEADTSGTKSVPAQDEVSCEIEIAAPPERVFRALTDAKLLLAWWGKEPSVELTLFEMDARRGGKWRFRAKPALGAEHGAVGEQLQQFEAHGQVLEYDPPRLLVWSWIANWHEHPAQPTVVRWELTPAAKGTRVRVTHSGLALEPTARKGYTAGWLGVLQLLQNFLQSEAIGV